MKRIVILLIFLLMPCFASAVNCNISLSITTNTEIFDNGEKIEFYNKLNNKQFDYIIEYWIEDVNSTIIKQKRNTTNQAKKTFTPKNFDADIIIKSRIAYLGCGDVNLEDNFAQKRISLKGNNEQNKENTTHKTIKISFTVNSDMQKLKNFAKQMESSNNENLEREEYKPKQEENKVKKAIPYFILILTTLISIVLIWKR